jgi:Salmonella virulence plasmid 65kDa B protein
VRGDGAPGDQPLIGRVDYGDRDDPSFLVSVSFDYEQRPDAFSDRRAGFEIRTSLRCRAIRTATRAADGVDRAVREYRFAYEQASFNGVSLLARVEVVGVDDTAGAPRFEALPPLTLGYSAFDPSRRRFRPVEGPGLPAGGLGAPGMGFVDLFGRGLCDIVELGTSPRYWSNRGDGRFALPRSMPEAPPHRLGEPGVQLIDADGDGRADLLVAFGALSGYFPMTFAGVGAAARSSPTGTSPALASTGRTSG